MPLDISEILCYTTTRDGLGVRNAELSSRKLAAGNKMPYKSDLKKRIQFRGEGGEEIRMKAEG
jgi:hypothetical protein